jgi:signal recognition particle subunit SRP54
MSKLQFTLDDFVSQMCQVRKLGPMGKIMGLIPGMRRMIKQINLAEDDVEKQMQMMQAVYHSMTRQERENPDLLNGSRRRRIADGAGTRIQTVLAFVRQFQMTQELMHKWSRWPWSRS